MCDGWVKVLARAGACPSTQTLRDALAQIWSVPEGCGAVPLVGPVMLEPTARAGATPMNLGLPAGIGPLHGLALLAIATVTGIVVLRWSRRTRSDALALGTLWGGLVIHALPRLMDAGTSFSEFAAAGVHWGLGDVAIAWAVVWLLWRVVAELFD